MTAAIHRATTLVLVLALSIASWGCAAHQVPHIPQPPSGDVRAELGTIGVPVAPAAPDAALIAPARGKAAGVLRGAGGGFVLGATPGLLLTALLTSGCGGAGGDAAMGCGFLIVTGLGAAAAGGTVGAVGGALYGLIAAESTATIAAAERTDARG